MSDLRRLHLDTRAGWDRVAAAKYRAELATHIAFLSQGGHTFLPVELALLAPDLPRVRHAIHLQCSHGLDALGLVNLGVPKVTGVDISSEMIRLAEEKTAALHASAQWICADVLDTPAVLDRSADLIFTGKGALPWILDLRAWAAVVARLLLPGGLFYLFEGHPLAALWDREASSPRLLPYSPGYFDPEPAERPGFPVDVIAGLDVGHRPPMRERYWRPGQVLAVLQEQGLQIEHFDEYPDTFWNQFPHWPQTIAGQLPLSYAILARSPQLKRGR